MPLTPFIGQIAPVAFAFSPRGWLPCDGMLVPVANYGDLYKVIGNRYGGDGTNFKLPDLRGRSPMGPSQKYRVGEQVGSDVMTLMERHIPQHTHDIRVYSTPGKLFNPVGAVSAVSTKGDLQYRVGAWDPKKDRCTMQPLMTLGGGQGAAFQPHENMPPSLAVHFVIAWQGIS